MSLLWSMVLVGGLMLFFGAAWAYMTPAQNADSPVQDRTGRFQSVFLGSAFASAGLVIAIVALVRLLLA